MAGKQRETVDLYAEQLRDRTLRSAFLCTTGALRARPASVRVTFDNAGRGSCPSMPWRLVQHALREVAREAARDGRPLVVAETRARITTFYETALADALAPLPLEAHEKSALEAALQETRDQGPSDIATHEWVATPTCRERLARAVETARRHLDSLRAFIRSGERVLAGGAPATTHARVMR